ncbi:MAG: hypothetical protein IPO81_14490 [Kouleothrix sp.]|nr:hypothetical protein [Kouleothrix sp.]
MLDLLRYWRALLALLLGVLLAAPAAQPIHAADERCFPETGQCISGPFRRYWEQNGGLAVFGYPISSPKNELNHESGQTFLAQWFERNRFELHPDLAPPYDILLGRLGDDRLRTLGVDWLLQPRAAGPQDGCLWFEASRHNVCDQAGGLGFKTYWQTHGLHDPQLDAYRNSLALFGMPLSEAVEQVSPTDGERYLTQWFERARFEWHPDKPDEFKVLLGLLGNELGGHLWQRITASAAGPLAASQPFVYWLEPQGRSGTLRSAQLDISYASVISDQVDLSVRPAAAFYSLAWVALGPDGRQQRVLFHQTPSRPVGFPPATYALIEAPPGGSLQIASLALSPGALYYTDLNPAHRGLYARSLADGSEQLIDANGRDPFASGDYLLWSSMTTNSRTGTDYRETWTLNLRLLQSGEQRVLTTVESAAIGRFSGYSAAADLVAWAFSAPGADNRVYLYHVGSGMAAPISPDAAGSPSVYVNGTRVAWATDPLLDRDPSSAWSVQLYDIASGRITTIAGRLPPQLSRSVTLVSDQLVFALDNAPPEGPAGKGQSIYRIDLSGDRL